MPLVAIVGRPNVGKSTFFNRLTESRDAIVYDEPGVTRDRVYGDAIWNGVRFAVVDTGGFVHGSDDVFEAAIREQATIAMDDADAIVLVTDSTTGITDLDTRLAETLRRGTTPVFVAVNKADNDARRLDAAEFYSLGFEHVYPISSINGTGTGELLDAVVEVLPGTERDEEDTRLRIAFIGRPNVGKSSLTNALVGEDRAIVTPIAGTTRDSLDTPIKVHGREIVLVDTAGLRRRSKVKENVEFYSTLRTQRAIERCDVAVLLLDGVEGLQAQDIAVLKEAERLRKGLVIVVNKWDLVEKETNTARDYERRIKERLQTLSYVPVVFVSALTRQRAPKVLDVAMQVGDERARRISTSKLNEVVQAALLAHSPPPYRGAQVKIKFATQVAERPPVFAFFANHPTGVAESYKRYLENRLRDAFGFVGVPLVLAFKPK
ncbi:MAG: ribosome biogenesis GTPase Der [Bacteroidetes bacterium]|nr:ribosome biogenesis GTPase Der [Bacteroidota bacterium]